MQVTKYALGEDGQKTPAVGGGAFHLPIGRIRTPANENQRQRDRPVTFAGLPIYGDDGKKITYIIRETAAPEGYTLAQEELSITL